jgi:ABC-type transport system involved in cytochrome c biogenesis permease subunit
MEAGFLALALAAYAVGIGLSAAATTPRRERFQRVSGWVLGAGWLFHLAAIVLRGLALGRLPLANLPEYLLVLGWVVLGLHLLVWFRSAVAAGALVLAPLAFVLGLVALLWPGSPRQLPPSQLDRWFGAHTVSSTAGMGCVAVAFAMSLTYLVQDRALKAKNRPRILRFLPSLDSSDRIGHLALLVGFPLLTVGIVTGALWSREVHHRFWVGGPKQTFPVLAWIVLSVVLYTRIVQGYTGRKSAYLTIFGFALGLLTVLGMTT